MAGKEAGRDQIMDRLEAHAKEARFSSQGNANSLKGLNGLNRSPGDFPGGPEVKSPQSMQGAPVQFLINELDPNARKEVQRSLVLQVRLLAFKQIFLRYLF